MSEEGMREAYARAMASRAPGERPACPAPEAILALVRREGDEKQRLSILDHVMACAGCRDEFELLRAIERGGEKAARAEAANARADSAPSMHGRVVGHIAWRSWVPLAAAAAILLVVAVGPGRRFWQPRTEAVRGGGEPLALIAPAEATSPASGTVAFVWHSAPGAERYTLELLTSGGAVALSRTTAGADTALTLALPATLAPGDYRWWVTATAGDGSETRSDMRTLRLTGR